MFDFIYNLLSNDMGIDLGTANTLVYIKGKGIVLREPSVVAVDRDSREVIAIGEEAKNMIGKTPASIEAVRPLRDGVIADFDITEKMIRHFIKKVHNRRSLLYPRIVIGIPTGITEVQRRAVRESAEQAGAREVHFIEEPMAAAIGADIPVQEPAGNMIVDIGGGTTEVAVISLGGMVVSKSVPMAGDKMDEALVAHFKKKHNLMIGPRTSEDVKITIGSAFPLDEERVMEVKGLDEVSQLPKTLTVSSEDVRSALLIPARAIIDVIKEVLELTPPELAADLVDRGIVLAGGGSLLRGFPELLSKETGLPVNLASDPMTCVVLGAGRYMESLETIKRNKRFINS